MDNNVVQNGELRHWGIKGMRWGIRRTPAQLGHKPGNSDDDSGSGKTATQPRKKRKISELSDEELRQTINRLQMEKQLKQLLSENEQKRQSRGKEFTLNVIKRTGEEIIPQITKHYAAKLANKMIGEDVIYANNKKK